MEDDSSPADKGRELSPSRPEPPGVALSSELQRGRSFQRFAAKTAGRSIAGFSALGLVAGAVAIAREGLSVPAVMATLILLSGLVGGILVAKRAKEGGGPGAESGGRSALEAKVRERLLAVASAHGGRVTAAEVAAALAMAQGPAENVLEASVASGQAQLFFTPEGMKVYAFPGLLADKATAKEPWDL
jgi:hypothetical protein